MSQDNDLFKLTSRQTAQRGIGVCVCVCLCVRVRQSQNTVIKKTSLSPVVSDISVCSDHSEHRLSAPLPVPDLQLDGHTAARGQH